jgi:hypothetical protein
MPKRIIPLTDMKVQKAKPQDKPVALFDGGVISSCHTLFIARAVRNHNVSKQKYLGQKTTVKK